MDSGKAVLSFIMGIILALLTFPVAGSVSIGLSYVFGIIALVLGAFLTAKGGDSKLPSASSIVLLITIPILLGTVVVHMGLWTLSKAVEETAKVKVLPTLLSKHLTLLAYTLAPRLYSKPPLDYQAYSKN